MADLLDVLREGIALADTITKTNRLQAQVTHHSVIGGTGGSGDVQHGAGVLRDALVEWKQEEVRTASGEIIKSRAIITFLDPAVVVLDEDILILPDGTTGPIAAKEGPIDRVTKKPMLTRVFLG